MITHSFGQIANHLCNIRNGHALNHLPIEHPWIPFKAVFLRLRIRITLLNETFSLRLVYKDEGVRDVRTDGKMEGGV